MPAMVWDGLCLLSTGCDTILTTLAAADRKLLLAIIGIAKVTVNNEDIAAKLSQDLGTTLTPKAISNRIYRLKQMADGRYDDKSGQPARSGTHSGPRPISCLASLSMSARC